MPCAGVTREDCLALSRLYAVQLLSGLCGDFQAAADWLDAGGAGLSEEQQEVRRGTGIVLAGAGVWPVGLSTHMLRTLPCSRLEYMAGWVPGSCVRHCQ